MAEVKYIVFALGEQSYSMKLSRIKAIEQLFSIVPIPSGPRYIKGIINLRNEVVPIYDLKEHFGISEERENANRQLLVSETHGLKLGFEVDDVLGIIPIPEEEIKEVPSVAMCDETTYVENVIKVTLPESRKEELIISVSVDELMSEAEFDDLSNAIDDTK